MNLRTIYIVCCLLYTSWSYSQDLYELDTLYPVHDLNPALKIFTDSTDQMTPAYLLKDSVMPYQRGDMLPRFLQVGVTYWGKIGLKLQQPLSGWTLHFEEKMIGPPAWTKSNGKVDVYAYQNERLVFHKKTGVEYAKLERDIKNNWMINRIRLDELPVNTALTLIIKVQGNNFGYPAYFNVSARSSTQPYYHQINQFHHSFNIFMFGVTFIIFLYHVLQFIYLRHRVFLWFSLWLLFCMMTQAMTVGLFIGNMPTFRYQFWMLFATGIYFTFWFFGRAFIESKRKFPVLDKFMKGLALFVLVEIVVMVSYVIIYKPQTFFTSVGIHYQLLNIYTVFSLVLSIILLTKKDLFARYFGFGSLIASSTLIVGTLWAMGLITPPLRLDPFVSGMFLQIIIYSFGIAYRQQKIALSLQQEKLQAQQTQAEIERMKDLDMVKTRFFANISHEFRTPLSLITGPLKQAFKQRDTHEDEIRMRTSSFHMIQKNAGRLQQLVDQLLDLSKLENGAVHLSLQQGDLVKIVRSLVFSFESMAERKNISLITNFPASLNDAYYDSDVLEKIVINLLSNAFKYTSEGGTVTINVHYDDAYMTLQISDTGKGINKEDIHRIFDRFYRVEGSEEKGSGIGLALTKELVDVYKGQISVNSTEGQGTTFKIRLPYTLQHLPTLVKAGTAVADASSVAHEALIALPDDAEAILRQPANGALPIVLVVEDNSDLREFITEILSDQYRILQANDGLQGERMAFEHIPDIIISDVMMPKKDGYELCHTLKNNQKTSHIPLLMLTAKAGKHYKMEGLTQGADAYVTKPFDADELQVRVKNLIDARQKIWQHFKASDLVVIDDLPVSSIDDRFLQKVIATINKNLDNELLSVEDLSSAVGFSRAQLHRKLKALTNRSAKQLIVEIRLNKAKRMLEQKTGTVSEIAYAVGYTNMSYFTKSFKEKFGMVPSSV